MNFYKHHIGDYAQATAHLSFVEDAAYSRMIRKYYAEESPLPADPKAIARLVGARTKEEREAVQAVLEEFFTLAEDGWHNKRCDAELVKANAQAETNRRIAEEREARRKAREAVNEQPTKRATKPPPTVHESLHESSTVPGPSREPSQTPDSRLQTNTEDSEANASAAGPPGLTPKERVWAMGAALFGDKSRALVGRLLGSYGEAALLEVLAEAMLEKPIEPKGWVIAGCEAKKVKAGSKPANGQPPGLLDDPTPDWAIKAGFSSRFTAENARCHRFNAAQFRDGRKIA